MFLIGPHRPEVTRRVRPSGEMSESPRPAPTARSACTRPGVTPSTRRRQTSKRGPVSDALGPDRTPSSRGPRPPGTPRCGRRVNMVSLPVARSRTIQIPPVPVRAPGTGRALFPSGRHQQVAVEFQVADLLGAARDQVEHGQLAAFEEPAPRIEIEQRSVVVDGVLGRAVVVLLVAHAAGDVFHAPDGQALGGPVWVELHGVQRGVAADEQQVPSGGGDRCRSPAVDGAALASVEIDHLDVALVVVAPQVLALEQDGAAARDRRRPPVAAFVSFGVGGGQGRGIPSVMRNDLQPGGDASGKHQGLIVNPGQAPDGGRLADVERRPPATLIRCEPVPVARNATQRPSGENAAACTLSVPSSSLGFAVGRVRAHRCPSG